MAEHWDELDFTVKLRWSAFLVSGRSKRLVEVHLADSQLSQAGEALHSISTGAPILLYVRSLESAPAPSAYLGARAPTHHRLTLFAPS